jgi:hypothetical protein
MSLNRIDRLTGRPLTLAIDGRDYAFHPVTLEDLGAIQRWLDTRTANPLDQLRGKLDGFTPEQQRTLLELAIDRMARKPVIGSPEAAALLSSAAGIAEFLYLSVRKGDPDFTREDAERLLGKLDAATLAQVSTEAMGRVLGERDDPKAAGPANGHPPRSTGGTSSTSSPTSRGAGRRKSSGA